MKTMDLGILKYAKAKELADSARSKIGKPIADQTYLVNRDGGVMMVFRMRPLLHFMPDGSVWVHANSLTIPTGLKRVWDYTRINMSYGRLPTYKNRRCMPDLILMAEIPPPNEHRWLAYHLARSKKAKRVGIAVNGPFRVTADHEFDLDSVAESEVRVPVSNEGAKEMYEKVGRLVKKLKVYERLMEITTRPGMKGYRSRRDLSDHINRVYFWLEKNHDTLTDDADVSSFYSADLQAAMQKLGRDLIIGARDTHKLFRFTEWPHEITDDLLLPLGTARTENRTLNRAGKTDRQQHAPARAPV